MQTAMLKSVVSTFIFCFRLTYATAKPQVFHIRIQAMKI